MSGGSHNYLAGRASDDLRGLAREIERMGRAVASGGFPMVAARTAAVAEKLEAAASEADALHDLWHAQEWKDSGDWGISAVRREAVKLGEELPPCDHDDKRLCIGAERRRWLECDACGEEFPAPA